MRNVSGGAVATLLLGVLAACGGARAATQDEPSVVQAGAPGGASRAVEATGSATERRSLHTEADVRFMQGMIHHHAQALEMTALAPERTQRQDILRLARRIEMSQADEIAQMQRWLRVRGEEVPAMHAGHHGGHGAHAGGHGGAGHAHGHHGHGSAGGHGGEHPLMAGMLTADQMARLAAGRGGEFDRLFLEYMIQHHEGALVMVAELFESDGGHEGEIFQFASHVDSDQRVEIARMRRMLVAGG